MLETSPFTSLTVYVKMSEVASITPVVETLTVPLVLTVSPILVGGVIIDIEAMSKGAAFPISLVSKLKVVLELHPTVIVSSTAVGGKAHPSMVNTVDSA